MIKITTFEKIREIIVEQLGVSPNDVQTSTNIIEDLDADSLDAVELIMAFEEEFNIEITDEEAEKFKTVSDIVKCIGESDSLDSEESIKTNGEMNTSNDSGGDGMNGRKFTILGETGSGKTCYLLGMYYEMSAGVAGYTVIATNDEDDKKLTLRYDMLNDKSRGASRFPAPTDNVQKMNFKLQYAYKNILPFDWVDYPGEFLDPTKRDVNSEQYKEVEKSIEESEVLFICIDGENLVGNDTRQKIRKIKQKCGRRISPYLGNLKDKLKAEEKYFPPIGMIITKYDLCADDTNQKELKEIIEEVFEPLFADDENFVAIIPVSLGTTLQDDSYQGELEPQNIHLPILLGINFALIDMLHYGKYLIEEAQDEKAALKSAKEDEEDRIWLFRNDDKIRKLNEEISEKEDEIQHNREVAKYFKKSLHRINLGLDKLDMIFANGTWLDERNKRQYWEKKQSVVEYF